jgi:hypothetical protein
VHYGDLGIFWNLCGARDIGLDGLFLTGLKRIRSPV